MEMLGGGSEVANQCRKPEIMSDAAYVMLTKKSSEYTGNFAIDDEVLRNAGVTDLEQYAWVPGKLLSLSLSLSLSRAIYLQLFSKMLNADFKAQSYRELFVVGSTLLPDFFLDGEDPHQIRQQMEEKGAKPAFGGGSKTAASGPAQTFSAIEGLLSEDLVSSMNGVFQFNLTGILVFFVYRFKRVLK